MNKSLATLTLAFGMLLSACNQIEAPSQKYLREQRRLGPALVRAIKDAPQVEIIAIDPKHPTSIPYQFPDQPYALARWAILGRKGITAHDDIHELAVSLGSAIQKGDGGYSPCFNPHHALRFTREGAEVLAIVCFDCSSVEIYGLRGFESVDLAVNSPEELATWNRIFRKYGLPGSKEAEPTPEGNRARKK